MVLYKHSNKLLFQTIFFISALIEILLLSGITYGWASIAFVFEREGFFGYLCNNDGKSINGSRSIVNSSIGQSASKKDPFSVAICSIQNKRFNLVFNVSVAFLCCAKFPIGLFIDSFGPRAGQIFGCCLYVIAGFGLAFVTKETSDLLFPIFIFFCIGGGFIAVTKYQMCRFFYTNVRSLVLSVLHGTFDSSAVILLFFKLAWEGGFTLREISLFYIILSFIVIILSLVFLTPPYKTLIDGSSEKEKSIKIYRRESCQNQHSQNSKDKNLNVDMKVAPDSLMSSILSPQYLLELVFMCFCQLRLWFFIGSLDELIKLHVPIGDEVSINAYNTYFGYAQLCGILVGPWIGFVFDRDSIKCKGNDDDEEDVDKKPLLNATSNHRISKMQGSVLPFFMTNLFCMAFSVLSLAPWKWGLIPSFIFHVVTRGFLYSAHASYIALAFRPERFATLYGLGIFVAGAFGLLEYPLYSIIYKYFNSDPFWVNLVLLFLVLSSNVFPLYLLYYCKSMKKKLNTTTIKFDRESNEVVVRL